MILIGFEEVLKMFATKMIRCINPHPGRGFPFRSSHIKGIICQEGWESRPSPGFKMSDVCSNIGLGTYFLFIKIKTSQYRSLPQPDPNMRRVVIAAAATASRRSAPLMARGFLTQSLGCRPANTAPLRTAAIRGKSNAAGQGPPRWSTQCQMVWEAWSLAMELFTFFCLFFLPLLFFRG